MPFNGFKMFTIANCTNFTYGLVISNPALAEIAKFPILGFPVFRPVGTIAINYNYNLYHRRR